jgi:Flp pilus assembly protein TadD
VRRLVASYLVDHDRCTEAIRILDCAPSDLTAQPGLALERARALMALGDAAAARAALAACIAAEPPAAMRADARRLLRFAADPELLPAIQRVEAHLGAGELSAALRGARRLLRSRREVPEAWLLLAIVHQRWGHRLRAMRAFRRSLQLQHDLPDAHNRLGVLLAGSGRHLEAYNHLRFAVELAPNESGPWLHLAQVCFRLGWREEAESALGRAQRLGGCEAEVAEVRRQNAPR